MNQQYLFRRTALHVTSWEPSCWLTSSNDELIYKCITPSEVKPLTLNEVFLTLVAVRHCLLCCCWCRHYCFALWDIYAGIMHTACKLLCTSCIIGFIRMLRTKWENLTYSFSRLNSLLVCNFGFRQCVCCQARSMFWILNGASPPPDTSNPRKLYHAQLFVSVDLITESFSSIAFTLEIMKAATIQRTFRVIVACFLN